MDECKAEEQSQLLGVDRNNESSNEAISTTNHLRKVMVNKWHTGFLLSLLFNILLVLLLTWQTEQVEERSKFAGLTRTISEPYVIRTPFSSPNETLQSKLWRDIDIDAGVVALSDEYAARRGLRTAQRFPWDNNKGIYILHGYHNLHCVKIIHISLDEYRSDRRQSRDWHHISHCIDALRRQVLCDADDSPRATERRVEVVSGVGQHRKCRSWKALESWARQHTACYRRPEQPSDEQGIERFKHCPRGSGYIVNDGYIPTDQVKEGLPQESIQENEI